MTSDRAPDVTLPLVGLTLVTPGRATVHEPTWSIVQSEIRRLATQGPTYVALRGPVAGIAVTLRRRWYLVVLREAEPEPTRSTAQGLSLAQVEQVFRAFAFGDQAPTGVRWAQQPGRDDGEADDPGDDYTDKTTE